MRYLPCYPKDTMFVTPNEAKRLGVEECHSYQGNSVGVQPTSGLRERVCIFLTPNRFASLGVRHIKSFGLFRF